jgi:restriction system protein
LLTRILEASPAFFEKMIIDLLLAMGYGGSRADASSWVEPGTAASMALFARTN